MYSVEPSGYFAASSRIRALYGRLLAEEQWRGLLEVNTREEAIHLLESTAYSEAVAGGAALPNGLLATRVRTDLVAAYRDVLSFLPPSGRNVVLTMMRRLEVENVKTLLRQHMNEHEDGESRASLYPLNGKSSLPMAELGEATGLSEVLALLKATPYGPILEGAQDRFEREHSLFPFEVALDLWYWRLLWRIVRSLSGQDWRAGRQVLGARIDALNVAWSARYYHNYHLSEEEIINYTLPFGWKVDDTAVRHIASGASVREVVNAAGIPVSEQALEGDSLLVRLEVALTRWFLDRARQQFAGFPFHVGLPMALLMLKEAEVDDVVTLIEAKSYGLPSEQIAPYLRSLHGE
jgi:vacuolar-type H+-ATPase subunit C/Vma6